MKKKFTYILGEKLTRIRNESGYDQAQLADEIGVSRQTINTWEGKTTIKLTLDKAEKLAKVLKAPLHFLTDDKTLNQNFWDEIREGEYIGMHQRVWAQHEITMEKQREWLDKLIDSLANLRQAGDGQQR